MTGVGLRHEGALINLPQLLLALPDVFLGLPPLQGVGLPLQETHSG